MPPMCRRLLDDLVDRSTAGAHVTKTREEFVMRRFVEAAIMLTVWLVSVPLAQAIEITLAQVQNGVAVVQGNKATKQATILWENGNVGQTTKGGSFSFSGVVPADCVGQLSIGSDTINVALANCTKISGIPTPVAKTGQTRCWDILGVEIACAGTGQDGEFQAGVSLPTPRFTDNGDGTVRDNATGLIWLKDGGCLGIQSWSAAFTVVAALAHGNSFCSLTDQSVAGDWRLPNLKEYESLMDFAGTVQGSALPAGHPFLNFTSSAYLVSTALANAPEKTWQVSMADGQVYAAIKTAAGGNITAVRRPK